MTKSSSASHLQTIVQKTYRICTNHTKDTSHHIQFRQNAWWLWLLVEEGRKTDQGRNIFSSSEWPRAPMRAVPRVAISFSALPQFRLKVVTSDKSPLGGQAVPGSLNTEGFPAGRAFLLGGHGNLKEGGQGNIPTPAHLLVGMKLEHIYKSLSVCIVHFMHFGSFPWKYEMENRRGQFYVN